MLADLLDALARQTYRDFEVVVIDDGSTDGSADVARVQRGTVTRVVAGAGAGAVAARCLGVDVSAGDIFAFTDSDCVPCDEWLASGVAGIDKGADLVVGVTRPPRRLEPLERTVYHDGTDGLYPTCNVFYRREAYGAAGGFDREVGTRLGFRGAAAARALGFGEDTLLAWRVARNGTVAVARGAVVHHAVLRPPVGEYIWREWVAGGFPSLVREAPELRGTLLRQGVFLSYRRVPLYVTVLALVLGGPRLALAACAVWAAARVRDLLPFGGAPSKKAAAVPVEMINDVVVATALIIGSVRSRTIVL